MVDDNLSKMHALSLSCQEFSIRHPGIQDPNKLIVTGSFLYTDLFHLEMNLKGRETKILHLQGNRYKTKDRHTAFYREKNPSNNLQHCVCIVDDTFIIDVTAMLFNTEGPPVRIMNAKDLNDEWFMIGSSYDALEDFNNISIFLERATPKWQKNNFPDRKPEDIEQSIKEYFELAKYSLASTTTNMFTDHLVFTNHEIIKNPLLKILVEDWRPQIEGRL